MTPETAQSAAVLLAQIARLQETVTNLSAAIGANAMLARVELTGAGGRIYSGLNEVLTVEESASLLNAALTVLQGKLTAAQNALTAL